jgi:hypothetical protein
VRIVLAVLALLAALVLVLVAIDVGRWRDAIDSGDRTSATNPLATIDWRPSTIVPFDPAARIVRLGDDIALREAIHDFLVARHTGEGFDNGDQRTVRQDVAQAALEEVVLSGSPRQVAEADVLLGVLAFDRSSTIGGTADPGAQSVQAFTDAARLVPSDTAAKFDLELVLRALTPVGTRPGSNPSAGSKGHGQHGAGAGLPGGGF